MARPPFFGLQREGLLGWGKESVKANTHYDLNIRHFHEKLREDHEHPPHKTVRARSCIWLPPWMCGVKALPWVRMQDSRDRNPSIQERIESLPGHPPTLAAGQD